MKYSIVVTSISLLSSLLTFGQDKVAVTSAIPQMEEVTVFLSGAEIFNTSKVTLQAGSNEVVFENASPYLNSNSVQIKALNNNVTIVSVNTQSNYLRDNETTGKLKVITDSLNDINLMVAIRQSHIKVYNDERDMILANKKIGGSQTLVTDDLEEMANYFRKRLLDIEMKLIDANKQLAEYSTIQYRLQQQEIMLKKGSVKSTTDIVVNCSSKSRIAVDFEISYVVSNAGWVPKYDIRANDLEKPVLLNFKADVYNSTGFDWNNIKITLSTGNPSIDNTQPNMNPWYIQYYEAYKANKAKNYAYGNAPAPAAAKYDNNGSEQELYEVTIASENKKMKSTTTADFTTSIESTVNNQFIISIPYTIKSDSKPYVVDIQNFDLPVIYKYLGIPKLDKDAFLLARIAGWENLNLLPGKATVYFEGSYVGDSYLATNSTSDTLDVSMGRDKNIIIQREKVDEFCKNTVTGGNKKSTRGFDIKVKNTKSKEVVIEIKDQIPLSSLKEVVVEVTELGSASYNEKTGELKWVITLKPGESITLNFKYQVKYPKDLNLTSF
jgi:uncharacterized protein (TIGR02231 family)